MTDELVEKVAKAIYDAAFDVGKEDEETSFVVPTFYEAKAESLGLIDKAFAAARAALQAIEESGYTLTKTVPADNYAKSPRSDTTDVHVICDGNGRIIGTLDLRPWKEGSQ